MSTPSRIAAPFVAAALLATFGCSGVAGAAAGDRTFQQTYPLASSLCAKIAAGTEGKRLKRNAAQAQADCATLLSSFESAHSVVLAARAALEPQIAAERAAIRTACPVPRRHPTAACLNAHAVDGVALSVLRHEKVAAARRYYRSIEAARLTFWAAIHTLRGGAHLRADAPIPIQNS